MSSSGRLDPDASGRQDPGASGRLDPDASGRHAWIDASAGIAGDMLLGALVDAGARLAVVQRAVEAVIPESVLLVERSVTRAGTAARKVDVEVLVDDPPHRSWTTIRDLLSAADLSDRVRSDALAVFGRLAEAEGRVHGVPAGDIGFHEVGALDSLADVVGVCAALEDLGITTLSAGEVALGSGHVQSAHGQIPVPVPAVLQLANGWRVRAGGSGELTTPTGMALLATLCAECTALPPMTVHQVGIGAGTKDPAGRANVTRVVVGDTAPPPERTEAGDPAVLLEANIDDLDPRLWPGVLAQLLAAAAADAWLVPILMKKGRPAHTLSVLCHPSQSARLRQVMLTSTTTIGVREHYLRRFALPRSWVDVELDGGSVSVKIAHRDGVIVQATPEFDEVVILAAQRSRPEHQVLSEAIAAAEAAGLTAGSRVPDAASSTRPVRS